jgi:hypothetical protein
MRDPEPAGCKVENAKQISEKLLNSENETVNNIKATFAVYMHL